MRGPSGYVDGRFAADANVAANGDDVRRVAYAGVDLISWPLFRVDRRTRDVGDDAAQREFDPDVVMQVERSLIGVLSEIDNVYCAVRNEPGWSEPQLGPGLRTHGRREGALRV